VRPDTLLVPILDVTEGVPDRLLKERRRCLGYIVDRIAIDVLMFTESDDCRF